MTKFTPQNARELAFTSLERVRKTKAYSNLQVDETLRRHDLSPADRRLVTTIAVSYTHLTLPTNREV